MAFVRKGVERLRITERRSRWCARDVMKLFHALGSQIGRSNLKEVTLTTNGSQLGCGSPRDLVSLAGVKRVNVSLDTRDGDTFRAITRWGDLEKVLDGIDAADAAGLAIKINTVALKGVNEDEIEDLMLWAHSRGFDHTLIETMPMGEIDGDRVGQYLPLSLVRARLARKYTLEDSEHRTGGPARYVSTSKETGGRLGFIHASHPQFLRKLQSHPPDLHGNTLHVP